MKLSNLEKFLILAHHPEKGIYCISNIHLNFGLAGALLLEATKEGLVEEKDKKLQLTGKETTDPHLQILLRQVKEKKKPKPASYWIRVMAQKGGKIRNELIRNMVAKHVFRIKEKRFLGLFSYKKSYLIEKKIRKDLISSLKKDLLNNNISSQDHGILLALIEVCSLHKILSSERSELKAFKSKLKDLNKKDGMVSDIDRSIKGIQSAIIASSITGAAVTYSN